MVATNMQEIHGRGVKDTMMKWQMVAAGGKKQWSTRIRNRFFWYNIAIIQWQEKATNKQELYGEKEEHDKDNDQAGSRRRL